MAKEEPEIGARTTPAPDAWEDSSNRLVYAARGGAMPAERQTDGWTKTRGDHVPAGAAISAARVERATGLASAERESRPAAANDHRSYRDLRKLLENVPDLDTPLARTASNTEAEYTI